MAVCKCRFGVTCYTAATTQDRTAQPCWEPWGRQRPAGACHAPEGLDGLLRLRHWGQPPDSRRQPQGRARVCVRFEGPWAGLQLPSLWALGHIPPRLSGGVYGLPGPPSALPPDGSVGSRPLLCPSTPTLSNSLSHAVYPRGRPPPTRHLGVPALVSQTGSNMKKSE